MVQVKVIIFHNLHNRKQIQKNGKKYQSNPNQAFDGSGLKNKEDDAEGCPILEQNKDGTDELLDNFRFIYNLETKTSEKGLEKYPS